MKCHCMPQPNPNPSSMNTQPNCLVALRIILALSTFDKNQFDKNRFVLKSLFQDDDGQRAPNPPEFAQPCLSRSNAGHPSKRVQIWVCLFIYDWSCPGVRLQFWVCLICVISPHSKGAVQIRVGMELPEMDVSALTIMPVNVCTIRGTVGNQKDFCNFKFRPSSCHFLHYLLSSKIL